MIQQNRLALTGITLAALAASVGLGFWAGIVTAQLRPPRLWSQKSAGS